jgi:hypothetical protein
MDGGCDNGLRSAARIEADDGRAGIDGTRASTPDVLGGTGEFLGGAEDVYATGIGAPDARFDPPSAINVERYNPSGFATNPSARK